MVETVALLAAGLFLLVALFQVAIAFGVPWGAHAYGGRVTQDDGTLPPKWRVASGAAALVLLAFGWVMLARAGVVASGLDDRLLTVLAWMVVAYMAINSAINLASKDAIERWVMGSVSVALVVLCSVVAAAGPA
jgi:hypothetical protein